MVLLLLFTGCAPTPASITFDGGGAAVTVHSREGIPLKRAVVRDGDGKQIDPQPYLAWNVDHVDVVVLHDETLTPVGNGTARVEARIGELSASYTVTVDLNDEPVEVRPTSFSGCAVTNHGEGVLTFTCGDTDFPRGLAAYRADHPTSTVTAVSPLVRVAENDISARALVTSYLVVTSSD